MARIACGRHNRRACPAPTRPPKLAASPFQVPKSKDNQTRLQLFALAYNLANFLRRLAVPKSVNQWTLTTLRERFIKIGAKVTRHSKYVIFQLAEVAVTRDLFAAILDRIARLAIPPPRLASARA
ncbi:MAG: transposase [Pirellulales bacterium]|nr:transposase [Pirellulales bacterium]